MRRYNMRRAMRCNPALGCISHPSCVLRAASTTLQGCRTSQWADASPVSPTLRPTYITRDEPPEVAYDELAVEDPSNATVRGGHAKRLASTRALRRLPVLQCDGGFAAVLYVFCATMPLLLYGVGPVSPFHDCHSIRAAQRAASRPGEACLFLNLDHRRRGPVEHGISGIPKPAGSRIPYAHHDLPDWCPTCRGNIGPPRTRSIGGGGGGQDYTPWRRPGSSLASLGCAIDDARQQVCIATGMRILERCSEWPAANIGPIEVHSREMNPAKGSGLRGLTIRSQST